LLPVSYKLPPAVNPHLTEPLSLCVTSAETHCTTTLAVHKQHCSQQHSPSTEPFSRCETSAEPTAPTQLQIQ